MGDAGLVELRRNHPDVLGQRLCDPDTGLEPGRIDAVVIGDEDAHGYMSRTRRSA